ncbi:MAG TPA: SDR family oxidoreductase [Acidimicrobiales bacterium]|nr:SDR family oxidoreductase [Acidimicrobiales bacterium]
MSGSGLRLLVVGASSGIGRAIAEAAVAGGDWVAVGARRRDQLEEIKGCHACITANVRDPADCDRLASEAAAQLGGLDALVYAPAFLPLARLVDTEAATWHEVLETSVVGAALVTRAALPWLVLSKGRAAYLSSDSVRRLSVSRPSPAGPPPVFRRSDSDQLGEPLQPLDGLAGSTPR